MVGNLSRRGFLQVAGGAAAAACAPAASPTSTASSGAKAAWETERENLIAAAKQEGKIVVHTAAGAGFRESLEKFAEAFPGIGLEHQQFPEAATYGEKIRKERAAGIYSLDAALLPVAGVFQELKPHGIVAPLRPLPFRPDVLDDKAWDGGFEAQWMDTDKQLVFRTRRDTVHPVWINTDMVKDGEIKTPEDLLNPKWKGQIVVADPRQGAFYLSMTALRLNGKEDVLKKLFIEQQPAIIRDRRQHPESVIRGKYPIGIGILWQFYVEFLNNGVGKNVKNVDMPEFDYQPSDTVHVYDKAPHPSAAKLFANWVLTKEGQAPYSANVAYNSSRLDVPVAEPANMPKPGVVYMLRNQEEVQPAIVETQNLLNELAKGLG